MLFSDLSLQGEQFALSSELFHCHVPLLCWAVCTPFLWLIPSYSRKSSNSFDANGGPLSLRRASGKPCVLKIASILFITHQTFFALYHALSIRLLQENGL